jgi:hypothetical protein
LILRLPTGIPTIGERRQAKGLEFIFSALRTEHFVFSARDAPVFVGYPAEPGNL